MSDIPTVIEEIERKTLLEFERIVHGLTVSKKINLPAAHASLLALWNVSAGLISPELMNMVSEFMGQVLKTVQGSDLNESQAVLVSTDQTVLVLRKADLVIVRIYVAGAQALEKKFQAPLEETEPATWTATKFKAAVAAMGQLTRIL